MEDVQKRVEEITKMLNGKISCWQDNELYWCLKTILLQNEKLNRIEYEIDNSDMSKAVETIIEIVKG